MNAEELVRAFESLQKLEHHYKNQYEEYIAKALAAKANLDRLEPLLKDLSSQLSLYPQQQESFLEFEPEPQTINGSRKQLELDWMSTLVEDTEPNPEPEPSEDKTENQEISHREFIKLSPQVMPVLESLFTQDPGKKLHLTYLYKAVNQQSQLGLSQDTVELFLEEAIALGYCERDMYDKQCYYSVSDTKAWLEKAFKDNPPLGTFGEKTTDKAAKEKQQQNQGESVTLTEPTHKLPPSQFVKMTIPDTILGYINSCHPKTFTSNDVVNYLYSETEQKHWSKEQTTQITNSIAGGLSYYNRRKWFKVRPGVYRPINR